VYDDLNVLANLKAKKEAIRLSKQAKIDEILGPELRQRIAAVEAAYEMDEAGVTESIEEMTAIVKAACVEAGTTIKGEFNQVVFSSPRAIWNDAMLMGYAVDHPEILPFRSMSKPSAQIR
jgi:hypothetical protein